MVSRRAFLQGALATVAAALLPSWRKFETRRVIDLTPFCDPHGSARYDMGQPFAQGGMAYATDARICVRTMLADVPKLEDEVRLPPANKLPLWGIDGHWRPWPKQWYVERIGGESGGCPICFGFGGSGNRVECERCMGFGEILPDDHDDYLFAKPCGDCRGSGWHTEVRCDYCGGEGQTSRPNVLLVEGVPLAGEYDSRVRTLGDVEYLVCRSAKKGPVICFRGDAFEGMVMPLRSDVVKR